MSTLGPLRAEKLMLFLLAQPEDRPLPSMKEIAVALGFPRSAGSWAVCGAFDYLRYHKRIVTVSGKRAQYRGHRIVRLPDGRVLKTAGCQVELP